VPGPTRAGTDPFQLEAAMPRALTAALLCLALTAAPAALADEQADDERDCRAVDPEDPESLLLCREDVWFTGPEEKAGNLNAFDLADLPTWDTEPPAESVTQGAGAGYLGTSGANAAFGANSRQTSTTIEGTFTGPIDNLAIEMYLFAPARQAASNYAMRLQVHIDGALVHISAEPDRGDLSSGGNAVLVTRFALTNILPIMQLYGLDLDQDAEHTITLSLAPWFIADDNSIMVWDTTEAPSGMVINHDDLSGYSMIPITG
jgi:hypothetical protein